MRRHTDKERLDWLEQRCGHGLISDDAGRWAVSTSGVQNMADPNSPIDIVASFFVEKNDWCTTIRKAIEKGIEEEKNEALEGKC